MVRFSAGKGGVGQVAEERGNRGALLFCEVLFVDFLSSILSSSDSKFSTLNLTPLTDAM